MCCREESLSGYHLFQYREELGEATISSAHFIRVTTLSDIKIAVSIESVTKSSGQQSLSKTAELD